MADVTAEPNRLAKWVRWVEERHQGFVYRDVIEYLIMWQQIWKRYQEILFHEAPDLARVNATYDNWATHNYVGAIAAGVRRQIETKSDRVSLGRLLKEMSDDGVTILPHGKLQSGEAAGDLAELHATTKPLVVWFNKSFGHSDATRDNYDASTRFGDVNTAVAAVFRTFNKYRSRLVGSEVADEVHMSNWEIVFTVAWLPRP